MNDSTRQDIRRLLKTFGIQADEALTAYLADHPERAKIQVRIVLEEISDAASEDGLQVVVEGEINQ